MRRISLVLAVLLSVSLLVAGASVAAEKGIDKAPFEKLATFKMGDKADAPNQVAALALESFKDPAARKQIERELLALLKSPTATADCKRVCCRQLVVVGSADAVAVLGPMLTDETLSHMARYALARLRGPEATRALFGALDKTTGRIRLGIVGSLGDRRESGAVGALQGLATDKDAATAVAAVAALGKIGGREAYACLRDALGSKEAKLRGAAVDGLLRCAEQFVAGGQTASAKEIYTTLRKPAFEQHVRTAALRGLVSVGGDEAIAIVMRPLLTNDPGMQSAAVSLIRDIPGAKATKVFAAQLSKLEPAAQALLIAALAERGDPGAGPEVLKLAGSKNAAVRVAALHALGRIGGVAAVPALVRATAAPQREEAGAARNSLVRLAGAEVDKAILGAIDGASPKIRVELIKVLTARRAAGTIAALLKLVHDADEGVRKEAFKSIGILAGAKAMPDLVALLVQAKGERARTAAERAVLAVAARIEDETQRPAALRAALPKATGAGKASLLRLLARFGGDQSLAAVRKAIDDPDATIRDAAIRSLCNWPDPGPADTLLTITKTTTNNAHRVLALRGYVRLIALPTPRLVDDTLKLFTDTMALAKNDSEKKLILSGMAKVYHPKTLELIQPYLADPALKAEAQVAVDKIKKGMNAPAKATASHGANKAHLALDNNPGTRWDTATPMRPGMWFLLEFGTERTFTKLTLECKASAGDYPRGYEVYVARDKTNWGKPVAVGKGTSPVVAITLKPASGRFLKIVQTGSTSGLFWSIHTLKLETK